MLLRGPSGYVCMYQCLFICLYTRPYICLYVCTYVHMRIYCRSIRMQQSNLLYLPAMYSILHQLVCRAPLSIFVEHAKHFDYGTLWLRGLVTYKTGTSPRVGFPFRGSPEGVSVACKLPWHLLCCVAQRRLLFGRRGARH